MSLSMAEMGLVVWADLEAPPSRWKKKKVVVKPFVVLCCVTTNAVAHGTPMHFLRWTLNPIILGGFSPVPIRA